MDDSTTFAIIGLLLLGLAGLVEVRARRGLTSSRLPRASLVVAVAGILVVGVSVLLRIVPSP